LDNERYATSADELSSIVGDTNLFFQEEPGAAEIEVMIAEEWGRRRGLATEALELMIKFGNIHIHSLILRAFCSIHHDYLTRVLLSGKEELGKLKFVAKIKQDNIPSIHIFSKLGFIQVSESQVFNEFTFELNV